MSDQIPVCHYEVLSVARDADQVTIKKAHRKLALKYHPDKNTVASNNDDNNNSNHAEQFRRVQQAYECLSDPVERKWYDQHRDAILQGWSPTSGGGDASNDIVFDVVPYQHGGCYNGYGDDDGGFFAVYGMVFRNVWEGEEQGWINEGNIDDMPWSTRMPTDFGNGATEWSQVAAFYQAWESFTSCLAFAWADVYHPQQEAPNRRVRRAMEDENKKARRNARKERNDNIAAVVSFCKRRDPRVQAYRDRAAQNLAHKHAQNQDHALRKKVQVAQAREAWRVQAEQDMAELEEQDRIAGRVRLADLEDEDDDYHYDFGGKKRGKKKNRGRPIVTEDEPEEEATDVNVNNEDSDKVNDVMGEEVGQGEASNQILGDNIDANNGIIDHDEVGQVLDDEVPDSDESDDESEPEFWRCECCRKDFKSQGQMENHAKSKKHKEAQKKYDANRRKNEGKQVDDLLDELVL